MADITVRDNSGEQRFEAHVDGELAGTAEYMNANQLVIFTHTEVHPRFEGKGVGSALVQHALDTVRAEGSRQVMPLCSFFRAWIGRHPEYESLVYAPTPSSVKD